MKSHMIIGSEMKMTPGGLYGWEIFLRGMKEVWVKFRFDKNFFEVVTQKQLDYIAFKIILGE